MPVVEARARADAEVQRLPTEAEMKRPQEREQHAQAQAKHPALLRMLELETLNELASSANARIYIGFDKHLTAGGGKEAEMLLILEWFELSLV